MVGNRSIVARESLQVAKLVVISSEQEHFKISEYPFMCGFSCSSVKFSEKHDNPQAVEIETGRLNRERIHEDDVATNRRVSWRTINATQERDIDSRHKGKAPRRISSSSSSDDGDNGGSRGWGLALVGAVEKLAPLVRVMLVKWILACHGHKEMKITMPHKIQIMDIDQGYGNSKSIWKG
ncbi:hypothetical protein AAG906_026187 [Vitis piasezkii]